MNVLIPYLKHILGCEADWNVGRRANNEPLIPCKCGLDQRLIELQLHDEYVAFWQKKYDEFDARRR